MLVWVAEVVSPENASSSSCSSAVPSGTSSLATSSVPSVTSHGFAGLLPRMLLSTNSSVSSPDWVCPWSPSIGPKLHTSDLHWPLLGGLLLTSHSVSSFSTVSILPFLYVTCALTCVFSGILVPILYYTNTWYAKFMPISSRTSFDNTGKSYKVRRILTADVTLDVEKYKASSPLLLSTTFAISYGLSFAAITATIMHTILFYRKQIWTQARRSLSEQADIHARLMSRYPQVPDWWYLIVFRK